MEIKEMIRDYWDYRSEIYSTGIVEYSEERTAWKNMLSSALNRREQLEILDVGTGPGQLALMFAEMGHRVTAVDLSTNMLDKARKNALKRSLDINFIQGDAEDLQFPDMQFDVVSSKFLLWTLPDPQKALSEWGRVLKNGHCHRRRLVQLRDIPEIDPYSIGLHTLHKGKKTPKSL